MHIRPGWNPEPARQSLATLVLTANMPVRRLVALTCLAGAAAVAVALAASNLGWLPAVADDALSTVARLD